MSGTDWPGMGEHIQYRYRFINRAQTALLVLALFGISALAGSLIFGERGFWVALAAILGALLPEPAAASALTLRLYHARPIAPAEAPQLWEVVRELAARAGLPTVPIPHYVPSAVVNAFATGSKRHSAIALTDGLLRSLTPRELAGVIAMKSLTSPMRICGSWAWPTTSAGSRAMLAMVGLIAILISLPLLLLAVAAEVNWPGMLLLAISPHLALLVQLGLSRVRELDADRLAAQLTGDPHGLASALAKIERITHSWRAWLMPGWGLPEPSWPRTHPVTTERIARLLDLAPAHLATLRAIPPYFTPIPIRELQAPRWHPGGFWR